MAGSLEGGDGAGHDRLKAVYADLKLVPYIDLLTCMVAFLLITAVWSQLARLQLKQRGQTEDETLIKPTKLAIVVHRDGFTLVADRDQKPLPRQPGSDALDYQRLGVELKAFKGLHADKLDVEVASEDEIAFDTIIRTMDVALASGFPDVSLVDAASARF